VHPLRLRIAQSYLPDLAEDYKILDSSTWSMILEVVGSKDKAKDLINKATFPEMMI